MVVLTSLPFLKEIVPVKTGGVASAKGRVFMTCTEQGGGGGLSLKDAIQHQGPSFIGYRW